MNTAPGIFLSVSRLGRVLALLVLCGLVAGPVFAKRMEPKLVKPVVVKNVEYSAPPEAMGFVVATDTQTKKELWRERIYTVTYDKELETDVQDIFITTLELDGETLIVTNERGARYALDLSTRKVTKRDK